MLQRLANQMGTKILNCRPSFDPTTDADVLSLLREAEHKAYELASTLQQAQAKFKEDQPHV